MVYDWTHSEQLLKKLCKKHPYRDRIELMIQRCVKNIDDYATQVFIRTDITSSKVAPVTGHDRDEFFKSLTDELDRMGIRHWISKNDLLRNVKSGPSATSSPSELIRFCSEFSQAEILDMLKNLEVYQEFDFWDALVRIFELVALGELGKEPWKSVAVYVKNPMNATPGGLPWALTCFFDSEHKLKLSYSPIFLLLPVHEGDGMLVKTK